MIYIQIIIKAIKNLYQIILFDYLTKKPTVTAHSTVLPIVQNDIEKKYQEALVMLKASVKTSADKANLDLKAYLATNPDLLRHAAYVDELNHIVNRAKLEAQKQYNPDPAGTPEYIIEVIEKRIKDFEILRAYKEKRQLEKDIRQARKANNKELYEELFKKWESTFFKKGT